MRLPELMPAHPAVDADDDEEDLAACLAPQIQLLGSVERSTDGRSDKDREQQDVAHDADGPRGDLAPHAQQSACQSEPIADDLPPQNDARTDLDLGFQQPQEYFLEIH
jgi:hypothetical protein